MISKRENRLGYALVIPSLLIIIAVGIIPILVTTSYSFQNYVLTDPLNRKFIGLENYIDILTNESFWFSLKNTLVFAGLSVVIQLVVGFLGALLMNQATKAVGLVRTSILIPWAIPGIITAYMFSYMFNDQLGVINSVALMLGHGGYSWLTHPYSAMFVVVLADTWKQFPYVSLMILAGLQTIPSSMAESARVDGAKESTIFWKVTLPNMKGVILVVLLFRTMGAIRIFDIIFGITGGGPANSTVTLLYQAYKYLFGDMNFGKGSAMSVIITLIILAISVVYIRSIKTEEV